MIVVPYIWKHLDTGTTGCREKVFFDLKHFDRVLAHWNHQHPEKWVYARDEEKPVRQATRNEVEHVYSQHHY